MSAVSFLLLLLLLVVVVFVREALFFQKRVPRLSLLFPIRASTNRRRQCSSRRLGLPDGRIITPELRASPSRKCKKEEREEKLGKTQP